MTDIATLSQEIFEKHSVTYASAAKLFPKALRDEVALLYAFVRLADEFVDNPVADPQDALEAFRATFRKAWEGEKVADNATEALVGAFVALAHLRHFEKSWIEAFFDSMAQDIAPRRYATWEELMVYVYGSAEVIGLMMNRLMGVDPAHDHEARALGASMQLINFLRDVHEDHHRDRLYIPQNMLQKHGITEAALFAPGNDAAKYDLVSEYIRVIDGHQSLAERGMARLPKGCRRPVSLASHAYLHTLRKIRRAPLRVFTGIPKNKLPDILWVALTSLFS